MSKAKPSFQHQSFETDLINSLFSAGAGYPWNPADPEAETYYLIQEQQFNLSDWTDEEVQQSATSFFAQLHSAWPGAAVDLVGLLSQKFSARIPQVWLTQVAAAATAVAAQQISAANQLVGCVKDLLPNWAEEDLLVLARPYAYAMRSDTAAYNIDNLARTLDWDSLSEMEQAKLTMLVTKYALDQLADAASD